MTTSSATSPRVSVTFIDGPLSIAPSPSNSSGGGLTGVTGASLSFEGLVRRDEAGRAIAALRYEAYQPMASRLMSELAADIATRHALHAIAVEHSVGLVPVGALSFRLTMHSAHRREALAAMDEFITRMKQDVPIWKMPVFESMGSTGDAVSPPRRQWHREPPPTPSPTPSPAPTLRIAETFVSIQGEGRWTGVPSAFIRVSGCNLRCAWCDTPYASWNPEGPTRPIDELAAWAATQKGVRDVVFTGGEPMLFDAIEPLARAIRAAGLRITIETAGTIHRAPATGAASSGLACDLLSISPKLANSAPTDDPRDPTGTWAKRHEADRLNIPTLQRLLNDYSNRQLKFVVAGPDDLAEIDALLAQLHGWAPRDILLMPEGVTLAPPGTHAWIVETCIGRGWIFCPRLHIQLFGNRRGT